MNTPTITPLFSYRIPPNSISLVYGDIDNNGKKEVVIATSDGFVYSFDLEYSLDQENLPSLHANNNLSPRSVSPSSSVEGSGSDSYLRVTNLLKNVLDLLKQYSSFQNSADSNSMLPTEVNSNNSSTSGYLDTYFVLSDESKLTEISKSQQFKEIDRGIKELATIELLHLLSSNNSIFAEKLAFFLNLHNLLTVHAIVSQGFPPFIKRYNFSKKAIYNIGGYFFSLMDIEHAVLRYT